MGETTTGALWGQTGPMRGLRAVAVDLDGTLLRDDKTYDRPRFLHLVERLQERKVRLVVASGNHREQILRLFGDEAAHFAVVSDNGALVTVEGDVLFASNIDRATRELIVGATSSRDDTALIFTGVGATYLPAKMPQELAPILDYYFPDPTVVEDMTDITGQVVKATVVTPPGRSHEVFDILTPRLGPSVVPVTSGNISVDILLPGVNKGTGLARVAKEWDFDLSSVVAFGDAANDLEMLVECGWGYAMANAAQAVMAATSLRAPANNEDGVLVVLEQLLDEHLSV